MRPLTVFTLILTGCGGTSDRPELVWGRQGIVVGDLLRPRAVAIARDDRLYIVDFTARIQVYDRDGGYLGPTWQTPDYRKGRPSGLGIDREGNLLVGDSHYHCVRTYSPEGRELRVLGGRPGSAPGELGYVSDVVQTPDGTYYVAEFGENQRISVFSVDGVFVRTWGREGTEPGQFSRIRALALGPDGLLYAADACNHRVQVFDLDGTVRRVIGGPGSGRGELSYPFDLGFTPEGHLVVLEQGNHRVQLFSREGRSLGLSGGPGRGPGQYHNPWAMAIDSQGAVHVLDTDNHRIQRIRLRPDSGAGP